MLKASHHIFLYPFFQWYAFWKIKRNFNKVEIISKLTEKELPVLVICNHFSWWDGFWVYYFNAKVLKRKFYFMMLENQLKKFSFFQKVGGYSVKKGSKEIVESLQYTVNLLADKGNIVLMFPQGRIETLYTNNFRFEKGIDTIISKLKNPVQIVFLANLIDYFSQQKPSLYIYAEEYPEADKTPGEIEQAYNDFYRECVSMQMKLNPEQ